MGVMEHPWWIVGRISGLLSPCGLQIEERQCRQGSPVVQVPMLSESCVPCDDGLSVVERRHKRVSSRHTPTIPGHMEVARDTGHRISSFHLEDEVGR